MPPQETKEGRVSILAFTKELKGNFCAGENIRYADDSNVWQAGANVSEVVVKLM
jgi:hypothetical protein